MRIVQVASELLPFSKTGGLADMVGALGKYLARGGHEVSVFTPLYRGIRELPAAAGLEPAGQPVTITLGTRPVRGALLKLNPRPRLTVYFVDQPEFFDRAGLYDEHGPAGRAAYPDNFARFVGFSRLVVEFWRQLDLRPQVVHAHDWQTGLLPLMTRHRGWYEAWESVPKSVFTIHNLAFPGRAASWEYPFVGLPWYYFCLDGCEYYGDVHSLKAGIVFADAVTTVSPRYAEEIMTPEFGEGLDGVLRSRRAAVSGILNGVDYDVWRTNQNPHLPHGYTVKNLAGKAANKAALQREVGLPERPDTPLFGTVGRLELQKGVDLILDALPGLLAEGDFQYLLLGSGNDRFEAAARDLTRQFPDRVAFRQGRDEGLAHRLEAGCDFFVMPSRYEPCGLNQMYSLRYGTVPIVRATGGLDDSVVDAAEDPERATGLKFQAATAEALADAWRRALALYAEPDQLAAYRRRGMQADFSWRRAVKNYAALYRRLTRRG